MSIPIIKLSSLDGSNGFRLDGEHVLDGSGRSVSHAGDVNGDGFDDLIVGASDANSNGVASGSSYVVFGKASGFNASIELSTLDGSNGFRMDGVTENDRSGVSVSGAGDVNGDGFADVIIGAQGTYPDGNQSYVVFGKAAGFDAGLNLSSLDGNNGFHLEGGESQYSISVSGIGDFNGDGVDDFTIGGTSGVNSKIGSAVVFGKTSGFDATMNLSSLDGNDGFLIKDEGSKYWDFSSSGVGDINGDGFDDLLVSAINQIDLYDSPRGLSYVVFGSASGFAATVDLSSLNGSNGFRLIGAEYGDGLFSGNSDGDFNGDGFDDLFLMSSGADSNGLNTGSGYVIFGKASGFNPEMNVSNLEDDSGFRVDGASAGDFSDASATAGDINGDGIDDLMIGTPVSSPNGITQAGSSYVIFGSRDFGNGGGELPEIKGTDGDDTLKGSETAEHFIAGEGNDNLLGRGGADVFDAGTGDDAIRIGDLTFASIDGGDGNDALHLAGADLDLDLTALGDRIHSIETICLYGRGDNTLTLSADSLLNLSDSTNTLKVNGNSGDHIAVQGTDWVDGGSHGFYHTFTHDDAVLLVGTNVTVEFV